jgi:hypothetical protein
MGESERPASAEPRPSGDVLDHPWAIVQWQVVAGGRMLQDRRVPLPRELP